MGQIKRKCQACSTINDREFLYKITYSKKEQKLFLNPNSKIYGYSIYVCKNDKCIQNILKRKIVEKRFSKYNPPNIDFILSELTNLC